MIDAPTPKRNAQFVASYARIADDLRTRVKEGALTAGQILPGRRRLAQEFGVAVGTIQQAIATLVEDGILVSGGWRGTFVAENRPESPLGPSSTERSSTIIDDKAPLHRKTVGIIAGIPLDVIAHSGNATEVWNVVIVHAIEHELSLKQNIGARYVNTQSADGSSQRPLTVARQLIDEGVDAIIALRCSDEPDAEELADGLGALPLVVATVDTPPRAVPFASHDNYAAGFDAATHLLSAGWRSLTFIAPFTATCGWQEERIVGAIEASRRFRIAPDEFNVVRGERPYSLVENHSDIGYEIAKSMLRDGRLDGQGIIADNDFVACGVRASALDEGLTAGMDYALIGFDNRYPSLECGITSLAPPLQGIGEQAARLIVRELRGVKTLSQIWLRSHLIVRASTRSRISIEPETYNNRQQVTLS